MDKFQNWLMPKLLSFVITSLTIGFFYGGYFLGQHQFSLPFIIIPLFILIFFLVNKGLDEQ